MPSIVIRSSGALPQYVTAGAAGMDVHADISDSLYIFPNQTALIPTGLYVAIPAGYELQIRPRSGFALNNDVLFPNSPGTIDSDYRGQIQIPIRNIGHSICIIHPRDRVAQMVCARSQSIRWRTARVLPDSARGQGGFGSTGR